LVIGGSTEVIEACAAEVAPSGDVVVIEHSVEALERLRESSTAPDVSYLIGDAEVLPLPDESVDLVRSAFEPGPEAAGEYFRVLRSGGRVVLAGPSTSTLNGSRGVLSEAGFVDVAAVSDDGSATVSGRKP
jgi:ubiquinone/menaquinone biosynthesis C-methylase UbiE